jgi:hypothetical protein
MADWFRAGRGHVAYVWAYSRETYERIGGLFEADIGSLNDCITISATANPVFASLLFPETGVPRQYTRDFFDTVSRYVSRGWADAAASRRVGFVPGRLFHAEHGNLINRGYLSYRPQLVAFEPSRHLTHNADGLLVPTRSMPPAVIRAVRSYFEGRREDDTLIPSRIEELVISASISADS